ncbi:ABC transporter ATP-binding protein [Flaviflexus massiliensis]|uniref:ABC transporter ATP-binding protein n=1 Tax=Flaviflexus massiliensis TaxID=1522309 RepID=UPI0006D5A100|nr:ABC transporter ATP-binding protein [Flaviflexus massiliensis]
MNQVLPIADNHQVVSYAKEIITRHRWRFFAIVIIHALASVSALIVPFIVGKLVDAVVGGTTHSYVNTAIIVVVAAYLLYSFLTREVQLRTRILGEQVFAEIREEFLSSVTALPLSTVESAGTGDLLSRTTNDVDRIQWVVRFGLPAIITSAITILVTVAMAVAASPLVALSLLVGVPFIFLSARRYLRRARPTYLWQAQAWAGMNSVVAESVDFVGTIDAMDLGEARRTRMRSVLGHDAWDSEARAAKLRMELFFFLLLGCALPTAVAVVWGAHLIHLDLVSIGMVTTVALYTAQLRNPLTEFLMWLDELQVASVSLARIVGVRLVPNDRTATGAHPVGDRLVAKDVRYAYREGKDVLKGINLDLVPGERLAIVGPSGAGKSTFGRMLAGIHPPTGGSVTVGGVNLVDLTEDELRSQVALVTQEHHVFVGSLAHNLRLAKADATDQELFDALASVDALSWVNSLENGIETEVGSGAKTLTPAQAQQVALARLVLLNPHTVVLDEATSLIDPRSARSLEASLSAVLEGRTVIAIAHRLYTAHDADRVAVIEDGLISELGTHDELVEAGGPYAQLWETWHRER